MHKYTYTIIIKCLFLIYLTSSPLISAYANSVDDLIAFASKKLGAPYKYGGKGPNYFDCSGYTQYVFKEFNIELAGSSSLQYEQGESVRLKKAKVGDLIFFKGSNANSKSVGHVGIISEVNEDNNSIQFIHASTSNGVRIDQYPGYDYYNDRYIGIKRVIDWNDYNKNNNDKDNTDDINEDKNNSREQDLSPEDPIEDPDKKDNTEEIKPEPHVKPIPPTDDKKTKHEQVHIVKKGETLFQIAKKYKCKVEEIIHWNKLNNNNISVGQKLVIKKHDHKTPKPKKKEKKVKPQKEDKHKAEIVEIGNIIHHFIVKGETLYSISKKYNCSTKEIQDWNNLRDNSIQEGETLVIKLK